ncbi:MAG TPA: VOC family protein [Mycobacteriales bacterium]
MHRILLREVVIDAPSDKFAAARDFWAAALCTEPRRVTSHPEFTALVDPAAVPVVGLQEIVDDQARFHVDLEPDDVQAEVDRLVRLGAEEVRQGQSSVVLRDPAGLLLCVVPAESDDFAERARPVPDPH